MNKVCVNVLDGVDDVVSDLIIPIFRYDIDRDDYRSDNSNFLISSKGISIRRFKFGEERHFIFTFLIFTDEIYKIYESQALLTL